MAVILSMTYQKKLGLPNFSSHSCSVSLTVEIPDASAAAQESQKLYQLLQSAVDEEIQKVGWMPDATIYGMNNGANGANGNGHRPAGQSNGGNGRAAPSDGWNCTEGQQKLILQLVHDHQLDKNDIETMAQQLFGLGVKELNKMQASNLIDDLLEKVGKKTSRRPRWQNRQGART